MTWLQLLLLLPDVTWPTKLFHSGTCRFSSKSQWLQANETFFKYPRLDQNRMTGRGNQIIPQILHSLETSQPQPHESSMLYPSLSDNWRHLVQQHEVLGSASGSNLMQNLPVITLAWQRGNPLTQPLIYPFPIHGLLEISLTCFLFWG